MKISRSSRIQLSILLFLLLITCKERHSDNPFDADCPKEVFTPSDFKAEQQGIAVKLMWSQVNSNISGFVINRNENDGTVAEVARTDKAVTSWNDNKIVGGTKYGYKLYAFAGANLSNAMEATVTTSVSVATVTTLAAASNITPNSAVMGGSVTSDGGAAVTERGICYGSSANPTTTNNKATMGNGTGPFSSIVTGLSANTKYYAKAYAINSYGISYGNEITLTTLQMLPAIVSTTAATGILATSAVLGGNVSSDGNNTVTENGVCYSLTQNPTTANTKIAMGSGTGAFSNSVTGLTAGTFYYVRAYAINGQGTAYGAQINFITSTILMAPTVTTTDASNVGSTSVVLGGNVTSDGSAAVTERGICYSITQNPTTGDTKLAIGSGTGAFSYTITGLTQITTYYARAYAINSIGTSYGNEVTFKTGTSLALATISTLAPSSFTINSALVGGNITNDGNATVTERGICYATVAAPTTNSSKVAVGSGPGTYTTTITGLLSNTTYYVRAYAINSQGTAYGNEVSFKIAPATLTTSAATAISVNTAILGGEITNDGNTAVIERGICYATTQTPDISNNKVTMGTGTGIFNNTVTGLVNNTLYYVRSYAINGAGTAYGNQVSFTTLASVNVPAISTNAVTSITLTTAFSGGNITSDGGGAITARGVCWATAANPTITGSKTTDGTGTGSFTSNLSGLTAGTIYYVRAYATNSAGTAYGNDVIFTTNSVLVATLTTTTITSISTSTAFSGGNITSDGGGTITSRGVCWATTTTPTISNSKTVDGSGTGSFVSNITGLTSNTTYYVRAYATNSIGTAYGNQVSFKTANSTVTILKSFSVPGSSPNAVEWDGASLWMVDNLNNFYRLDTNGIVLKTFAFHTEVYDLAWDGNGLWAYTSTQLEKIDANGNILSVLPISYWPGSGIAWDGTNFWIGDYNSGNIYKHDYSGNLTLYFETIFVGHPTGMAFNGSDLLIGDSFEVYNRIYSYSRIGIEKSYVNLDAVGLLKIKTFERKALAWDGNYLWYSSNARFEIYKLKIEW
jgi:hypothetical protein